MCCTLIRELIVPNFTKILCQPFGNCDTQLLLICVAKSRKIMESWRADEARQHLEQRIEIYTSSKGLCFRHDLPLYPIIALLKNFIRSHWLSSAPRGLHKGHILPTSQHCAKFTATRQSVSLCIGFIYFRVQNSRIGKGINVAPWKLDKKNIGMYIKYLPCGLSIWDPNNLPN